MELINPELIKNGIVTEKSLFEKVLTPVTHDLTKRHISSEIDLALGFRIKKIEEKLRAQALAINPDTLFDKWGPMLHNGAQTWVGLDFQILQCTYHDLKIIFDVIKPKPGELVLDLGAGYGRIGIYLHEFLPLTRFLGIELVPERVYEANRIFEKLQTIEKEMMIGDLSTLEEIPDADFYFIYDFGTVEHISKILDQLITKKGSTLIVKGRITHNLLKNRKEFGTGFQFKKLEDVHLFYL